MSKSPYAKELNALQAIKSSYDGLEFLDFCKGAWEAFNDLHTALKLARPKISEGDMQAAVLIDVIDEVLKVKDSIHFVLSVYPQIFVDQFAADKHLKQNPYERYNVTQHLKLAYNTRLEVEKLKIYSDIDIVHILVEMNSRKLTF